MALRKGTSGEPKRDLRREHERLDSVRAEIGERFKELQRREHALERALAAGQHPGEPSPPDDPDLARTLEEKEFALARRQAELEAREAALAAMTPPIDPDARLAEIEARLAELRAAEAIFTITRRELEERSVAVEAAEQRLRQREQDFEELGRPGVSLPDLIDPPPAAEITDERAPGFSGGLLELQRRGLRRRGR